MMLMERGQKDGFKFNPLNCFSALAVALFNYPCRMEKPLL